MRPALLAGAVSLLAWAALVVPVPILVLSPVQAQPVTSIIETAERPHPPQGEVLFTGVSAEQATTVGAVTSWADEHRRIAIRPPVVPADGGQEDAVELQRRIFRESVEVAAAAAMREAGMDVELEGGGAEVVRVARGAPAEDELREGDVIVQVDGRRIRLASELASMTSGMEPGTPIDITFERGTETRTTTLEITTLAQTGEAGIGVAVRTVDARIGLPVEVSIADEARVGGASAGLVIALTIYDLLVEADLTGGRTIAGTGAIDLSGRAHPVSGVPEKVRGAELADADVFVVPAAQADEARAAAPDPLRIVAVEDLADAVSQLADDG